MDRRERARESLRGIFRDLSMPDQGITALYMGLGYGISDPVGFMCECHSFPMFLT